jgi:DNA-binding response OmpR family regulator
LSQFYEAAQEVTARWTPQDGIIKAGDTVFAERASLLTIAGKEIRLSRLESSISKLLLQNAGHVVPRKTLCGCARNPSEWFLGARISALRKKLGKKFRKRLVTIKEEGYMYRIGSLGQKDRAKEGMQSI